MNWALFAHTLRLVYLLRVPLAVLLTLALLGPLALFTSLRSLLRNLLDLGGDRPGLFQVSFTAFLLAYAAVVVINLVLYYGDLRFPDGGTFPLAQRRPVLTFIVATFIAFFFLGCVVSRTEADKVVSTLIVFAGFASALVMAVLSKLAQLALTNPKTTRHPPPYLIFPAYRIPWLQRRFDDQYCDLSPRSRRLKGALNRWSQWPLEIFRAVGQGYLIDCDAKPGQLELLSGHVFALSLSFLAFVFYLSFGAGKRFISEEHATVTALAYLLLFLLVLCWGLSALTFFFDRYRFPLFWTILGLAAITANAPQSDQFFRVERLAQPRPTFLTPSGYLKARLDRSSPGKPVNLILIATPGGGIQAGAWTTQVLAELQGKRTDFRSSVALISSVSGGSLGSLIYAASFDGRVQPADVTKNSQESALDEVAWGLTQPDFWRIIAPWFGKRTIDRGWALEEKWTAINHLGPKRPTIGQALFSKTSNAPGYPERDLLFSDWAQRGAELPALIFNSMLVERGQHVVFSTTQYPAKNDRRGVINFYDLYPDRDAEKLDVRVATAARLSASFPYVAPAARPDVEPPYAGDFHFVDGGYYDNYGIDALIGWMSEALADKDVANRIGDVLVLQLRHFNPNDRPGGSRRGWGFQTYAPLSGLLSMWDAAPVSRDLNELALARDRFNTKTRHIMWTATISFKGNADCEHAPLSWKLSDSERKCLTTPEKSGLHDADNLSAIKCVTDYLSRKASDKPTASCQELK